jgi:hypothetical protein
MTFITSCTNKYFSREKTDHDNERSLSVKFHIQVIIKKRTKFIKRTVLIFEKTILMNLADLFL